MNIFKTTCLKVAPSRGAILLCVYLFTAQVIRCQLTLDEGVHAWKSGEYRTAARLLLEYRAETDDRNGLIDYMIGTSDCRLPDLHDEGAEWLRRILQRYKLSPEDRVRVNRELRRCPTATSSYLSRPIALVATLIPGVSGKGGFLPGKLLGNSNSAAYTAKVFTERDFQRRLFDTSSKAGALDFLRSNARSAFTTSYRVNSFGRYLFATSSGQTDAQLQRIAKDLEKYVQFYEGRYQMVVPSKFITVYLVNNMDELDYLAAELHGLRLTGGTIGYSCYDDLSMAGIIHGTGYGTLAHELLHLMIRKNFGDAPPWLEEGMASAYAVSEIRGSEIVGVPNWRGPILKRNFSVRPSIKDLLAMGWDSFVHDAQANGEERRLTEEATTHALACYFVLYLQDKQKLGAVYDAFRRATDTENLSNGERVNDADILESVLRQPVSKIDDDFSRWFKSVEP